MAKFLFVFVIVLCAGFALADVYSGESGVFIQTQGLSCVKNDTSAYWDGLDNDIIIVNQSGYNFLGTCNQSNNLWCCPNNYVCVSGACVSGPAIDGCSKFTSKPLCEGDFGAGSSAGYIESLGTSFVGACSLSAYFSNANGVQCVNASECDCVWDNNECVSELDFFNLCADNTSAYNNSCFWREGLQEDKCEASGTYSVNYIVSGSGVGLNPLCQNQTKNYPCSVSVKVPFFDFGNFVISALGICFIYFVFRGSFQDGK